MAFQEHRRVSASIVARCAVVTLSDTRTAETDASGQRIRELLAGEGHTIARSMIIPDEPSQLLAAMEELLAESNVDVILTNGGTGISRRDQTVPVIERLIEQPIPGFGELFRMLSWEQVSSAAMLSRAVGGISNGKLLFAMPGSTKAVDLAMTRLILPELKHLIYELRK